MRHMNAVHVTKALERFVRGIVRDELVRERERQKVLNEPPEGWISSKEAAVRLGVTRRTVNSMAAKGRMRAVRVKSHGRYGWTWYVPALSVQVAKLARGRSKR